MIRRAERPPQRIQRDQQLHQVVVRRVGGGLDHEHVLAADVLLDLDEHLHVGEAADRARVSGNFSVAATASARGRLLLQATIFMLLGRCGGSSDRLDAGTAAF